MTTSIPTLATTIFTCALLCACGTEATPTTKPQPTAPTLAKSVPVPDKAIEAKQKNTSKAFEEFWQVFQKSVASDNYQQLIKHTKFPFILRGITDGETERKVTQQEFRSTFEKILSKTSADFDASGELIESTLLTDIKQMKTLAKRDIPSPGQPNVIVKDFRFEIIDGKWMLIGAFYSEE